MDPNGNVDNTVIHVGFEDSKNGPMPESEKEIKDMLLAARGAFPESKVFLTSVLPARTNKNWSNIDTYNNVIKDACERNGAEYIDLTSQVLSPNCKKVNAKLYTDEIHLNSKGTEVIAKKIQNVISPDESNDKAHQDSDNDSNSNYSEDDDSEQLFFTLPVFEEKGSWYI